MTYLVGQPIQLSDLVGYLNTGVSGLPAYYSQSLDDAGQPDGFANGFGWGQDGVTIGSTGSLVTAARFNDIFTKHNTYRTAATRTDVLQNSGSPDAPFLFPAIPLTSFATQGTTVSVMPNETLGGFSVNPAGSGTENWRNRSFRNPGTVLNAGSMPSFITGNSTWKFQVDSSAQLTQYQLGPSVKGVSNQDVGGFSFSSFNLPSTSSSGSTVRVDMTMSATAGRTSDLTGYWNNYFSGGGQLGLQLLTTAAAGSSYTSFFSTVNDTFFLMGNGRFTGNVNLPVTDGAPSAVVPITAVQLVDNFTFPNGTVNNWLIQPGMRYFRYSNPNLRYTNPSTGIVQPWPYDPGSTGYLNWSRGYQCLFSDSVPYLNRTQLVSIQNPPSGRVTISGQRYGASFGTGTQDAITPNSARARTISLYTTLGTDGTPLAGASFSLRWFRMHRTLPNPLPYSWPLASITYTQTNF